MFQIYKKAGFTPLQALTEYKETHPEYKNSTLSYAGRLDPMAEGILLILEGDENKQRRTYEHMSKTYEFEILVGFSTDTYDVMGCITKTSTQNVSIQLLSQEFQKLVGSITLPYPPYSSKYVNGHPLYWYAKRNKLHTISIPSQNMQISRIDILNNRSLTSINILESITERLMNVQGNFRQKVILEQWKRELTTTHITHQIITCSLDCTSGTYVRSIVHYLSQQISIPLVTYTIKRTAISTFTQTSE